jgi:hypothetical protein
LYSQRACKKLAALHATGRWHLQNLDATGSQSLTNCTRVAASCMQIVPGWPPVACNMNKINGNLHATGSHSGTMCMLLATNRVQFVCDWPPDAFNFCIRLAATRVQFEGNWPPVAPNFPIFASDWRPLEYNLFATGRQTHIIFLPSQTLFDLISSRQFTGTIYCLLQFESRLSLKVIECNRMERQYCGLYKLFYCCYFMSFSCLMSGPKSLFQALNAYILECEDWAHRVYRLESARLSLQSSKLASPTPSPASGCCSPLWFQEGTQSLAKCYPSALCMARPNLIRRYL